MEQQCPVLWSLLQHLLSVSVREWCVCSYEVHLSAAPLWQSCDARGGVACMLACVHSYLAQGMAAGSTLFCPTLAKSGHGLTETMHVGTSQQLRARVGTCPCSHVMAVFMRRAHSAVITSSNWWSSHHISIHQFLLGLTGQHMRCTLRHMRKPRSGSCSQEMLGRRTSRRQLPAP
jgi:hypothetical protein